MLSRTSRHDQTSKYAKSGLFKALGSFSELERRIADLPTEQQRGEAFEVFIEAYLANDNVAQAESVWVVGKVPPEIRRRLNLPPKDYGYDGVYQTRLGELVPYQAKFRTGRASLPYAELATFLAITEKGDRRVVLTNSLGISDVAASRSNFQATRGSDLDRLDSEQLVAIAAWIEGVKLKRPSHTPRPHQLAALADIGKELAIQDRTTVVMACGTGKTLVALWAAEQAHARRVLVLVPSLNLVRQTLHEWAKWTNWGERFRYLCVCSDPKVATDMDEIEIKPEDADFPVGTDEGTVNRFLNNSGDTVSVVFCTYQSAPVVGAAMKDLEPFDLGIFDEAHKTAGRGNTRFAFALDDKNLPIRKRLFMTATPRHYDIGKRDKEGNFAVISMDDENVYGRVTHRLTFAKAAQLGIIVPYKVVISIVDSQMLNNVALNQSDVIIDGDPVRAKWVAHQIALKRAVERHNLKRIITFHSSIKAASAFASDGPEGIGLQLPSFRRFHVSGLQNTAKREEKMIEFGRATQSIMSNARCLTEGVDVPSVDMVVFMNPRRSRVDIVQAVGRAMRTAGNDKTCGYVLIPLFLELRGNEGLEAALDRSGFSEVVAVLNAIRENDDELDDIIQEAMIEREHHGRFDESRLSGKLEVIGPTIGLHELEVAISTQLVKDLGITWNTQYGQLVAHKKMYGHCNVPSDWAQNPKLGKWCDSQRTNYMNLNLSPDRVKRLEAIGFLWNPTNPEWESMFSALVAYKETYGNCNVPRDWTENKQLARWCNWQTNLHEVGTIYPRYAKRLSEIHFFSDRDQADWEEMFTALEAYRDQHGNCNIHYNHEENPKLGKWCSKQRNLQQTGEILPGRAEQLTAIGFLNRLPKKPARGIQRPKSPDFFWDRDQTSWQIMFTALEAYRHQHGHCNVPHEYEKNQQLGKWCSRQRYVYSKGRIHPDRIMRLEKLGFIFDPDALP